MSMKEQDQKNVFIDATCRTNGKTGVGLIALSGGVRYVSKWRLTNDIGAQQAEETAILLGLYWIRDNRNRIENRVDIFSDSLTSLHKIKNKIHKEQIAQLRQILQQLNDENVTTRLIRMERRKMRMEQIGIDTVAREGSEKERIDIEINKTNKEMEKEKHKRITEKWQIEWKREYGEKVIGKIIPKVDNDRMDLTFKATQLITGHGHMNGYFEKFKIRETDMDKDERTTTT